MAGLAFYNKMYRSGYELSCKFSDSILTDEESERQQDRQDVSMGVMSTQSTEPSGTARHWKRQKEPASTKSGDGVGCEKNTRTRWSIK